MLKILGGRAKGCILSAPKNLSTRPTSVLIRRKLFDWRQNLQGWSFVDICAGSGAMGLEALSRGAEEVLLNDVHRDAYQVIQKNAAYMVKTFLSGEGKYSVSQQDVLSWIKHHQSGPIFQAQNVILFFDPPYAEHRLYQEVLSQLKTNHFSGEIWVESDRLKGLPRDQVSGLFCSVIKTVEHGDHFVVVGKLS